MSNGAASVCGVVVAAVIFGTTAVVGLILPTPPIVTDARPATPEEAAAFDVLVPTQCWRVSWGHKLRWGYKSWKVCGEMGTMIQHGIYCFVPEGGKEVCITPPYVVEEM